MSFITSPGVVGFSNQQNITAPNNLIPVSYFLGSGAAFVDIDVAFEPKGAGSILAQIPDNTIVGGNKRANRCVDLQLQRNVNTQVASGAASGILSGAFNTANGAQSVVAGGNSNNVQRQFDVIVGGQGNSTNGTGYSFIGSGASNSITGGNSNVIDGGDSNVETVGSYMSIGGGFRNSLSGSFSAIVGGQNGSDRGVQGAVIFSNASYSGFQGAADSQSGVYVMRRATANAVQTALSTGQNAAPTATTIPLLPDNSAFGFVAQVTGKSSTADDAIFITLTGLIRRGVGIASTTLTGAVVKVVNGATAGAAAWTADAAADTVFGGISILVTGAAATNIRWTAVVTTSESVS